MKHVFRMGVGGSPAGGGRWASGLGPGETGRWIIMLEVSDDLQASLTKDVGQHLVLM